MAKHWTLARRNRTLRIATTHGGVVVGARRVVFHEYPKLEFAVHDPLKTSPDGVSVTEVSTGMRITEADHAPSTSEALRKVLVRLRKTPDLTKRIIRHRTAVRDKCKENKWPYPGWLED